MNGERVGAGFLAAALVGLLAALYLARVAVAQPAEVLPAPAAPGSSTETETRVELEPEPAPAVTTEPGEAGGELANG